MSFFLSNVHSFSPARIPPILVYNPMWALIVACIRESTSDTKSADMCDKNPHKYIAYEGIGTMEYATSTKSVGMHGSNLQSSIRMPGCEQY